MNSPRRTDAETALRPRSALHLPHGRWTTVLDCLAARFPSVSRERWLKRMADGLVCDAAGTPLGATSAYRRGLEVRYYREPDAEPPVPGVESIVYADEDLVVADKPHYLAVAPAGAWATGTLVARLMRRLGNSELVALHRIDRATAGLVLLSARPETRAHYQGLFRSRRIVKTYEALAPPLPGLVLPFVYRSRLVPGEPFFRMRECEGRPNSETQVVAIDRDSPLWRYELVPVTGRKHQLRVHMAALGAPIANDPYYPTLAAPGADDPARPLALLARALEFVDPLSGRTRRFETGLRLQRPDVIG